MTDKPTFKLKLKSESKEKVKLTLKPKKIYHGPIDIYSISRRELAVNNPLRARQLLFSTQDGEVRSKLRGKIVKKDIPSKSGISPPSALMTLIKTQYAENPSSVLGIIVEYLLRSTKTDSLNYDAIPHNLNLPNIRETAERSEVFTTVLLNTVEQLHILYQGRKPKYDVELGCGHVTGHPDIVVGTHIYEVKWTTQLKKNFTNFLLQLFTYGAMEPKATHIHLVLPAQSTIMTWDLKQWSKRELYLSTLIDLSEQIHKKLSRPNHIHEFQLLSAMLGIGTHIGRQNGQKLCPFVLKQNNPYPTQLFIQGNLSTKVDTLSDCDIAKMNDHVINHKQRIFVHAPYSINLCIPPGNQDDYGVMSLIYNLQVASAAGFLGVIVHTGQLTRGKPDYSMDNMETNIWKVLAYATEECPLLIETPAREGSEQLNDPELLAEFVMRFHKDCPLGTEKQMEKKIGICVDTCHVFSAGHQPMAYLNIMDQCNMNLIRLIHFNDSLYPLGSCKDRHELPGRGEIPWEQLSEFAYECTKRGIPILTE